MVLAPPFLGGGGGGAAGSPFPSKRAPQWRQSRAAAWIV